MNSTQVPAQKSGRGTEALYTDDVLALALKLANFPLSDELPMRGDAVSRTCGSRISMGFDLDAASRIINCGALVSACAIGQAAAAIFLSEAQGKDDREIALSAQQIATWLSGSDKLPDWRGFAAIERARDYPARHEAILLPWKAAQSTLSNA